MGHESPPDAGAATEPAPLAITWLGHATVLVELDGTRVLTDPVLRGRVGPLVRVGPPVRPADAGPVDCVLLSHLHADHADLPTLRAVARSGPIVAPRAARDWLAGRGLRDVRELSPGEQTHVGGLAITATPAEHDPRRRPFGPAAEPVGFVVRGSSSVYFAGDTDLFAAMAELNGLVDIALLPIWGWGSGLGPGHLDPERAAAAVALIAPAVAIPIHWGTFTLSRPARRPQEPARPAREFAELAQRYAPATEVRILSPGERATFAPAGRATRARGPR